jgi:hypothetical protein
MCLRDPKDLSLPFPLCHKCGVGIRERNFGRLLCGNLACVGSPRVPCWFRFPASQPNDTERLTIPTDCRRATTGLPAPHGVGPSGSCELEGRDGERRPGVVREQGGVLERAFDALSVGRSCASSCFALDARALRCLHYPPLSGLVSPGMREHAAHLIVGSPQSEKIRSTAS